MSDVRVRFEIAALGHGWRDEVTVTRTPLVDNLIAGGRLTVLEEETPAGDAADAETPATTDTTTPAGAVSWFAGGEPAPTPEG